MRGTWFALVLLVLTAWCLPRRAAAQSSDDVTRGAARSLGYSGVEAYQAGDFESASEKLEKAYVVLRAPSLGLWSARALAKRGKLVEASGRYLEVTTLEVSGGDVEVQKQSQAEARAELDALGPRIPSLVVRIEGAAPQDATVMLDGRPLATALIGETLSLNPGRHVIEARRGNEVQRSEVTLEEQQHESIVLAFAAPPPAAPEAPVPASVPVRPTEPERGDRASGQRTLGFIALGAGAVGIGLGTAGGLIALGKYDAIKEDERCRDESCLDDGGEVTERVNAYNRARLISTIGFIAGGAFAAGGTILLLTTPSSTPRLALWVGPQSAALRGRF
jgi:hypothetical protein